MRLQTCSAAMLVSALASPGAVASRIFTIYNNCPYTIWPAIFTDLNVGSVTPNRTTGWQQDAYLSVSFSVPDNWRAGRIWGRRNCDCITQVCLNGGCNGGLVCDPHSGTGIPPATLAEFTLGQNGGPDNYAVSLVDGFNLPMTISNNVGCPVADCPVDLGPNCPDQLKGPFDSNGLTVGCKSACAAGLSDPTNSPNCCTGPYSTPQTCPSSGVQFYEYFKGHCPRAYAYAYDDPSALFNCPSKLQADYTITFCP